jgi:catechol 2,3-dioxygenase-like lactoylglutathione lyase family enzyme
MINGGHVVIYSKNAKADRDFIKDVLRFKYVDAHEGWLIFKLPPSEIAVHPSDENDAHQFYLMTDNLEAEIAGLKEAGVKCEQPSAQSWGRVTHVPLPGGGKLGLYEPRHLRP